MKQSIPQYMENLSGKLWGVTVYYNPARYKTKLKNYKQFRKSSQIQGLKLLAVELAFDDTDFELDENDADILIQRRGTSILWQKERLLNLGLDQLPEDCDKVAWLDADIIFSDNLWPDETCRLLNIYKVVQPFAFCTRLPKGFFGEKTKKMTSFNSGGEKLCSAAYAYANFDHFPYSIERSVTGFAWAARRSLLDECRFYDRLILGGGDGFMSHALFTGKVNDRYLYSEKIRMDLEHWAQGIYQNVKGSIFFTQGELFHLWHGSSRYRSYTDRYDILKKYKFDPDLDIKIGSNSCWEWATTKHSLHRAVRTYFWLRNEDANLFLKIVLECIKAVKMIHRFFNSILT